jgi:hypothetical protein
MLFKPRERPWTFNELTNCFRFHTQVSKVKINYLETL